jgi:hypothetical protein
MWCAPDRRRLQPLVRDSEATTALRSLVRARRDLVTHRVAVANQLRAHLQTAFPAGACLFADLDSAISLRFLERFPTQDKADWLSPKRLAGWLRSVGYTGRTDPAVLHDRLVTAPRGVVGAPAQVHAATTTTTASFVAVLRVLAAQIATLGGTRCTTASTWPPAPPPALSPRWPPGRWCRPAGWASTG